MQVKDGGSGVRVNVLFELILKFKGVPIDLKRRNFANRELKSIFIFFFKIMRGPFK